MNRIWMVGNLTRDAELRSTPSGVNILTFAMASNYYNKAKGENVPTYLDVICFGKTAEWNAALAKGQPVFVEGQLTTDNWVTGEGQKRSKLKIVADTVRQVSTTKEKSAIHIEAEDEPGLDQSSMLEPF